MREIDLIFNFSQVFTEFKDIILQEILQYYDLDEQKYIKKRIDDTLFIFYNDTQLKISILENEIMKYEKKLITEMSEKLGFNDKNIDNIFVTRGGLNSKLFLNIVENSYDEDILPCVQKMYTTVFQELGFNLDYNDNWFEQVRNNKEYYKIIEKINNEMIIYNAKLDSFKNYIQVKYKTIYDSFDIQCVNKAKMQKYYEKNFLEFLAKHNLLNKKDQEHLKSNELYMLFDCYNIFFDDEFENGDSDYVLDYINTPNALDNHHKERNKVISYLNDCNIPKEKFKSVLLKVKEYRNLIRNDYLLNTLGEEKEIKDFFDWYQKNLVHIESIGENCSLIDTDKLWLLNTISTQQTGNCRASCVVYHGHYNNKILHVLKFSAAQLFCSNVNYFQVLIHEMIHVVDGIIEDTGYLNEILVDKFSLIIYEKIKPKLKNKYPFIEFDKDWYKNAYQDLYPVFDNIINANLFKYIKCKGIENRENTLYEYFGKENIEELIKLINETFDKLAFSNLKPSTLLNDTELIQKVNTLKNNIENYIISEEKDNKLRLK